MQHNPAQSSQRRPARKRARPLRLAITILAAALTACSTAPPESEESGDESAKAETETRTSPAEERDSGDEQDDDVEALETAYLLREYNEIAAMSAKARHRTSERLRDSLRADACSPQRLKLAMIGGYDSDVVSDASQLLSPCLEGDASSGATNVGLARLLEDLLTSQRARREAEQRQSELAQQRQTLRHRNQDLKEQIEGLKSIERSLQQRDE